MQINCYSCSNLVPSEMEAAVRNNLCPYCNGCLVSLEALKIKQEIIEDLSKIQLTAENVANLFIQKYISSNNRDDNSNDTPNIEISNRPSPTKHVNKETAKASLKRDILPKDLDEDLINEDEETYLKEDIEAAKLLEEGRLDEFFDEDIKERVAPDRVPDNIDPVDFADMDPAQRKELIMLANSLPKRGSSRRVNN